MVAIIDKNVKHETLKTFLKAAAKNDYFHITPHYIRSTVNKDITVEGERVSIFYHHYLIIESDISIRYGDKTPVNEISLSWGDASNFYNFLKASNLEALRVEAYPNNSSDWSTKNGLGYETVIVRALETDKKYKEMKTPNGYSFKADKTYLLSEGNKWPLAGYAQRLEDLSVLEFKEN